MRPYPDDGKAELENTLGNSATRLEEFRKEYNDAKSDRERQELLLWVGYYQRKSRTNLLQKSVIFSKLRY